MKRKYCSFIIIGLILISMIVFVVVRSNSLRLALNQVEVDANHTIELYRFNFNGQENRVIKSRHTDTHQDVLVWVKQNELGFWAIQLESNTPYQGVLSLSVTSDINWRRFEPLTESKPEFAHHIFYVGDNAIKLIELDEVDIPNGMAINISQYDENYTIHANYSSNQDNARNYSSFNLIDLLLEKHFIDS